MRPFAPSTVSDGVLALSDDLSATLTSALTRAVSDATAGIAERLREGRFEDAKVIARELTFTKALKDKEPAIRKYSRSCALTGAGAVDKPTTSIMTSDVGFPWEVDKGAVRLLQNMIEHLLLRDTRKQLLDLIGRAERFQKKADPIDPNKLASQINKFLRGEIRRVVDVSANIVGTRVAAYGMFYEARVRGISRYRIDAILDDRTTDICRDMHGREFSVEQSYTKTATVLSETDPAKQKTLAPFPTLDEIKEKTDAELQAMGHSVPPFHFLCRSVVTLIETSKTVQYDPIPDFPTSFNEVSKDAVYSYFKGHEPILHKAFGLTEEDLRQTRANPQYGVVRSRTYAGVRTYTGGAYRSINRTLRDNSEPDPDDYKTIGRIDDAFENTPAFTEGQFLYRGVSPRVASSMQIGKVYQDDGIVSTTLDPTFARRWKEVVVSIYFPKGAKGIPIERHSANNGEMEVIFQRGSQFRIIGESTEMIAGERTQVIRAVWQGVGEVLPVDDIGNLPLPAVPDSVVKQLEQGDKFSWEVGDLKEASFG